MHTLSRRLRAKLASAFEGAPHFSSLL